MGGVLKRAAAKRVSGEQVSPVQAALAAVVAGVVAAALTYRVMRS
jgi:hypothetical protein